MTRSFVVTFLGRYRGSDVTSSHEHTGHAHTPHEAPMVMVAPVLVLAALSAAGGFGLSHTFLPYLTGPQGVLPASKLVGDHALSLSGIVMGSLPGIVGIAVGVVLFLLAIPLKDALRRPAGLFEWLFAGKYFFDEIYGALVVAPVRAASGIVARALDNGIVDGGVSGVGKVTEVSGELVRRATTGQVATYVVMFFIAVSVFLALFVQR